jgi:hypothetical protein
MTQRSITKPRDHANTARGTSGHGDESKGLRGEVTTVTRNDGNMA